MKILIISFVLMISGCGMRGDLYLPEEDVKADSTKTDNTMKNGATAEQQAPQYSQQEIKPKANKSS